MEEPPPPPPPPSDLSDAVAPQPTAAESGEEKLQSVPQCKEVDGRQSTQSMGESATEEPDRLTEESAVPNPQCPQSDDGVERRSAADEEEEAESMSAVEEEEKPQVDGSDERVSSLREEKLVEEVEKASSLKEEEEKVLTSEPGAAVDEVMQENVEEKISDVAGSCPTEELDGERPQLAERNEKVYSLKEKEEEEEEDDDDEEEHAPHSEPAVDVIMPENLEEKPRQTEELNRERHQPAEGDGQGYSLQQAFLENEENSSSSEEGLDGEEEEKIPVSGGIMQESVEEKLPDFGGMQPAEQLDEKMPHSTEKDENLSSLQEEFVAGEEKVPLSQLSGSIADVDEIMHENVEGKLPEEQLNEDKPQSVRKGQKVAPSRRGLEEEDEKVSSLQEEYAEKDEKVSTVQEESDDKEEFDEKEEAEEMDMDEPPPAMAAGRRTGTKRKRGRPPVAQGRKARALPKPKEEEEELCFICFDGGDLVVCDHRGCPKVYHPSCVNRDEAYFKAKGQWSCGWHICSNCQKSARYMCYTCTYSLCKRCIKEAEFFCVRGNRGFCETCMKTVMQIEMNKHADETTDVVDFDDKASWMYLFKDYWIDLKAKLSLTIEELTGARNPLKETSATSNEEPLDKKKVTQWNKEPSENPGNASDDQGGCSSSFLRCYKERDSSRKKVKKRPRNMANKEHSVKGAGANRTSISEDVEWASEELLEFVAHMKDGDRSVQSQFDVQALLLEYIKQNNFRDPRRKSQVICDSRLRALFGKSCVGHLEMLKLLEPHFLIKEASPLAADDNQGGVVDPDPSQTEADGNNNASTKMNLDTRHKPRRRVEEKGLINLDDYAAIDVHNVSLMYLRRKLMEDFLDDIDMFNENVVGSFIRIRISGSASNKDMYRLVQVVGTSKAAERYNTGKKTTDTTLEVLNLNKREFLTIDLISNQEFTEEECKRLRQSVKCGFIDRLTAAEVQEKAKLLHTVKVNDWFESEKLRLGHLRDRASEKGRKKEHRECVEKLQLLSTLEERNRRLNEIPEIHVDPNMAPDYDSTEDEDDLNAKRQDNDKMPKSSLKDRDEFSARRGGSASRKNSDAVWNSNRSTSKPGVHDVVLPTVPADRTNGLSRNHENDGHQVTSPTTPKAKANATGVDTVVLKNAQPVVEHGQSSGVWPETAPQPANVMSSNTSVTEKMWHYQDPAGKIQGPFSMTQLRKWNASNFFPTNLRIWRTSEKQEDSILLTDALTGKFHRDLQQQEPQHSNSTHSTNVPAVVDSRVNRLADGMRGNNNQTTASFPATGNYNSAKCDRWTTQPSSLSPNNTGIVSPMDRRPTKSSTGWESSKDSNAWSGQSQVYNSPRPITPLSRNSSQQPSFQGRDGRGGNTGRWNGGRGHQNNWNSNKHRRFQTNGRGYERQHPYQSSSSQQFPGEQWKMQPANDSPNQLVSSSARGPKPSSIDWASLQGALNRILPSSSIQPMSSGPSTIPRGSEVQQFPYNLTSPLMNSVGGWTSNSLPNVNPAKTQETVGVMSNFQQQNKPSASPALLTSGNHAFCSGSNTAEFVDGSDWKQRLESDNSNTTPNSEQASSDVLNSGSIQPANSQLNEAGDRGIPSNKLDSNKKCPEVHDRSASENRKTSVGGTGPELGPASVAPNALGSSNIPDASVSVQRLEASSSKAQFEYQCWPPASSQQQAPNNSSVNPNPAQPLNMGWGMAPQHPNPGLETVQEIGNMVYPAIPGAANMGWGMMAHELMNMMWGTPANLNWVQPAQSPMNAHLGWAIPQQGNANVNLALGAQTQANPNAGWVMPMQVNSAQNPGWVAPNVGNASPNSGCVAPTEGNANQNAAWGTLMLGTGQGNINNAANQNGGGGKTDSFGDGGSSHALPPAEQIGVCIFHENGRCKKGASCNYIHS